MDEGPAIERAARAGEGRTLTIMFMIDRPVRSCAGAFLVLAQFLR
jgi:hypothetical protein